MAERERKGSKSTRTESKTEASMKNTSWKCTGCNKDFKEDDSKMLECERCAAHYCIKCVKFSDREYEFISTRQDLHWFCFECESKVIKNIMYDKEIEE